MKTHFSDTDRRATCPLSYGLIESCGRGRTDIDRDEDGDYWEDCQGMSRRVHPVGRPGLLYLGKTDWDF